jgi:hypothetical protein
MIVLSRATPPDVGRIQGLEVRKGFIYGDIAVKLAAVSVNK